MRRARLGTAQDRILDARDRSNGIKRKIRRLYAQPAAKRLVLLIYHLHPIYVSSQAQTSSAYSFSAASSKSKPRPGRVGTVSLPSANSSCVSTSRRKFST